MYDIPALYDCLGQDPALAEAIERIGPCRLRGADGKTPYQALFRAIIGQQLHGRAAEAILGRVCALAGGEMPSPEALIALPEEELRRCGLSAAKLIALRGLAQARLDNIVPGAEDAAMLDDETLVTRLTALRGVGRWTVEMLLIFTLGRQDVLPVDDFAIRAGWQKLRGMELPPRPAALRGEGERFAPWRSGLAWYLWRLSEEGKTIKNALTG
ncbi:DNA-3-methyladenine glycosylase family protein [Asaia krungthepensis]|uniref:DNA-3-methyladenine glycosylase II n=1 Tax=Asaia krungthepensis NRIC 0535 TaxID=1307925 RepID=A0ABQ0PVW3_9PROT|nr:DNA-3-methyladenine glycosylase 2 family protein [Asaia krungthepensis]GBQ82918.1 DNA-3-methyladenine glycosylase [Asaia krungthepensis NRIC 0535]